MKTPFVKIGIILVAVTVLAVMIVKFWPLTAKDGGQWGAVERGDIIQRVTLSGSLQPVRKALIVAPYNGYVKQIFVKTGDKIKAGDPIVSMVQSLSRYEETFPLRSPISGLVVQIRRTEGEYVTSGSATDFIVRVDDMTEMYVTVNAAEIDRMKMVKNQEAILTPMSLNQKTYKAQIVDLALAANDKDRWDRSSVVEYPIKMKVIDADDDLKSGMTASIDIVIFKKENLLTLRHEFIYTEGKDSFVILMNGDRRPVKIGVANEEKVEILEGLQEGERVQKVDFAAISGNS